MSAAPTLPDLPQVSLEPSQLEKFLTAAREIIQTREGNRGLPLDKGVTFRELLDLGIIKVTAGGRWYISDGIGSTGPAGPPGVAGPPGTPYVPDYTAPPTPTGLTAVSLFRGAIVEWDAPVYTQGHGNAYSTVYVAQYGGTGPLPTFASALPTGQAGGATTMYLHDAAMGAQLHFWLTFTTTDGVESVTPAGGLNGVQITVGLVGNSDLGDLIITADKLSAGTYPGINLVPNSGAEDGTEAWALAVAGTGTTTLTSDTAQKTSGSRSFKIHKAVLTDGQGWGCRAFPVIPGETYAVKIKYRSSASSASGFYLWAFGRATAPAGGYVTGSAGADPYDNASAIINNAAVTTSWAEFSGTYTVPAGLYWLSLVVYDWYTLGASDLYFDDVQFGRQITAAFMAAGSIAVGSAAIADGAIRNALIENLAVDNAKIASMSAAKLTAGSLAVGEYAQSTGFVAGTTGWIIRGNGTAEFGAAYIRGQLTAAQINANGLTIRDAGGNIILDASGSGSLDWRFVASQPGPNLIVNPEFANDPNGPAAAQGWTNGVSGTPTNNQLLRPTTSPSYGAPWNLNAPFLYSGVDAPSESVRWSTADFIEINESENYTVACWARWGTVSDVHVYLGCECYDSSGASLGSVYPTLNFSTLTATWTRYPGVIGPAGAVAWPAGTVKVKVRWLGAYNNAGTSYTGRSFATRFTFNQGTSATNSYLPFDPSAVTAYNQITAANAAVYIASAAIGWAQIGDLNINTSGAIHSGQTAYDTGTGYYLEYNGGTPRASFGSSTKGFLWDGSNFVVRGNVIATGNLLSNAVTGATSGSVSGLARSVTTVTSRTSSKTIGAITTSAGGDGRVVLFAFPTAEGAFVYYGYLIEASIGDLIYGDTYTIDFAITRTIGAAVTTVYDQSTTWTHTGGAGETVTRFSYVAHLSDTPGAGVTATYKIVITTTASGAAVKMAREVVAFNYTLIEFKK